MQRRATPAAAQHAQREQEYAQLVARIDPLVQGLRRAVAGRGWARLTVGQRLAHRWAYGLTQGQTPFEQFTSRSALTGGLYRQVKAGKKYLCSTIDGWLVAGLNVDEWYLRVRERCATDCCWRVDDTNRERHIVVIASNVVACADARSLLLPDAAFDYAEEQVARCAQALGIPDDEVES